MGTHANRIEALEVAGQENDQKLTAILDQLAALQLAVTQIAQERTVRTDDRRSADGDASVNGQPRRNQFDEEADREHQPLFGAKLARLEFPTFAGEDPTVWFSRVEQFFEFQAIPEGQKVSLASYHLEGDANQWWQWLRRTYRADGIPITWESFSSELWARFGPSAATGFDEILSHIKQTGSLKDYQTEFERLGNRVRGWSQQALVGTFLGGLKPEIAEGIRIFNPRTLREAISLARVREEQLARYQSPPRSSYRSPADYTTPPRPRTRPTFEPTFAARPRPVEAPPQLRNRPQPPPGGRRIPYEEMHRRRQAGLCFNCDEKFTPTHRCAKPRLMMLLDDEEEEAIEVEEAEVSFHAITGRTGGKTMRVWAQVGRTRLVVLIDSGSTHNFINNKTAEALHLPGSSVVPFNVRIANGAPLKCDGRHDDVMLNIQGTKFPVTLYAIPLAGFDIVLGIQWLETLGTVQSNWKTLAMEFDWAGRRRQLQGITNSSPTEATLKCIMKEESSLRALCLPPPAEDPLRPVPQDLQDILRDFGDLFDEPSQLPPRRQIEHRITLKEGTEAINVRPYRYAYFQKGEIEEQVNKMLAAGLIQPSTSPFSSPVLLVKKKDGTWRFCTDYRALNSATIKDRFPIPTVEDMLDELHGAAYFTKLDLRAGYHQVRMHPADVHKTAFRTHNGHYEYLVMPFGLCNAPSTFQAVMNEIFRPMLRKFVLVFFDDILVYSPDMESHQDHVRKVLLTLRHHKFFVKFSKCAFGLQEIEYLGHIITNRGVKVDPSKIQAMLDWPRPTTVTELRGFLGLTGYYRKFVRDYGSIARALTNLLKKGQFDWSPAAEEAFHKLKTAMSSTPVLAMPNFNAPFIIETDASDDGIGAVLMQNERPIAYMSRALGKAKQALSTYAKEMLAIVTAIQTWRPYILGRRFIIRTDQSSLKHLLGQRITTPEQQRWVSKLVGFDYEITYKPGRDNQAADSLSRRPPTAALFAVSIPHTTLWEELKNTALTHPYMQQITARARSATPGPYSIRNDMVLYRRRVVIPPNSPLVQQLMREFHSTPAGGHSGILRTQKRLAAQFYWPGMLKDVQSFVNACDVCNRAKAQTLTPAGLLQPLPIPTQVWEDISMDFVDGLPSSGGKSVILVVVDRLTKYAHFLALSHPYTARTVVDHFVTGIVRLHGPPRSIVSDRDRVFMSHFWQELHRQSGTTLLMSSSYHPQTDGQTEVVNRCVEQYLRCFTHQQPKRWLLSLPWAEYWYNTSFHSSAGMTPFQALYGRQPPAIPSYRPGATAVHEADQTLLDRNALLNELKTNLSVAQHRMKQNADLRRREVQFAIGDWVYLKLQPYRQHTVFRRASQKLAYRYYGPYLVTECIVPVAYRLGLPPGSRVHPVFHVSLLRPCPTPPAAATSEIPPIADDGALLLQPTAILDTRYTRRGSRLVKEVLVQWQSLSPDDATWESATTFYDRFVQLDIEDNVVSSAAGNDETIPLTRHSTRVVQPNRRYRDYVG
ncbi:unnamed protein product [Linum trigynum]|uniref:Reverse transcriptase n=1 Tax=Linum trigynum TaxID=586398 RepID=A0AAV2F0H5_9ROSI